MRYKAKNRKAAVKGTNTALRAIMIKLVAHIVMLVASYMGVTCRC
jgi:hypothetical protein